MIRERCAVAVGGRALSRCLVWVGLLSGLAVPNGAQADIVLGPGGHLAFGGTSHWETNGQNYNAVEGWYNWGDVGDSTLRRSQGIPNRNTILDNINIVGVSGTASGTGPIKLSSAAIVNASDLSGGINRVRSWSAAVLNDSVMVQPVGGSFGGGTISLQWTFDGGLYFELNSRSGAPLNAPNGFSWGHLAHGEVFAAWQQQGQVVTINQPIGQMDVLRSGSTLTSDQSGSLDFLQTDQTRHAWNEFAPQYVGFTMTKSIPQTGTITSGVPMMPGQYVPVMLGLASYVNVLWDLVDYGMLDSSVAANFAFTAQLTGVRLYNPDGSPYAGQWELLSQNGYDYPEITGAVPEPGTLLLMSLGVAGLALRRKSTGHGDPAAPRSVSQHSADDSRG